MATGTASSRTLAELWQAAGERPFDAVNVHAKDGATIHVCGISPHGDALAWDTRGTFITMANVLGWLPAPAPKRYVYPALIRNEDDVGYWVSVDLFPDDEAARKGWGTRFVRLLTDRGVEVP